VKRISDGEIYALKKVKMGKLSSKEKENALNEVRILASFMHPNIIAYKEAFFEDSTSSLCIVMELADGGDLLGKVTELQKKGAYFEEKEIWQYFIQMVRGIKALHDLKILHRDLKSANIFWCKDGTIKLGDLNVSKVAKKGLVYTQTGTPYYASPEVWKDQPYDGKSDIWSLGCVLYEITAFRPPFKAADMQGLYKSILKGDYPAIPRHFSSELSNMIKSLLQVRPSARPTCDQILSMQTVVGNLGQTLMAADAQGIVGSEGLIGTIKLPRNLGVLSQALPKANYSQPLYIKRSSSADTHEMMNLRNRAKAAYATGQPLNQRLLGQNEIGSSKEQLVLPKIREVESRQQRQRSEEAHQGYKHRSPHVPATNQISARRAPLQAPLQKPGSKVLQNGGMNNILRKDGYPPAYRGAEARLAPTKHSQVNVQQVTNAYSLAQHYSKNPVHGPVVTVQGVKNPSHVVARPSRW